MTRLSKSSILLYKQCPRKWRYRYIDKIKVVVVSLPLIDGKAIHSIFEYALKIDVFSRLTIIDRIKKHKNYIKYKDHCDNFINEVVNNLDSLPLKLEMYVNNTELNFIGYIDAVFKDSDNNVLVLDYKTGKSHPLSDYYFELALYAWTYEQATGEKASHYGIFFSKTGEFPREKISAKEIEKALKEVKKTREQIEYGKRVGLNEGFPKKISGLCKWDNKKTGSKGECEYYNICKPRG